MPDECHAVTDKVLTLHELEQAAMSLRNGKAPGIDGLPIAFYKVFWSCVGKDLLAVLRESFGKGAFPLAVAGR